MGNEEEKFVKILVDLPDAEYGVSSEGLWTVRVGEDLYEVRNSPWYTLEINFSDVVRAIAPSEDKNPVFIEIARRGGHRSIRVLFLEGGLPLKDEVLKRFNDFGANYENGNGTLYAIDLKPSVKFNEVADYLQSCEEDGWLFFEYAPQPQPKGTLE